MGLIVSHSTSWRRISRIFKSYGLSWAAVLNQLSPPVYKPAAALYRFPSCTISPLAQRQKCIFYQPNVPVIAHLLAHDLPEKYQVGHQLLGCFFAAQPPQTDTGVSRCCTFMLKEYSQIQTVFKLGKLQFTVQHSIISVLQLAFSSKFLS